MNLGVHLVNFTLPGGPASIGPTLSAGGRAADEAVPNRLPTSDTAHQVASLSCRLPGRWTPKETRRRRTRVGLNADNGNSSVPMVLMTRGTLGLATSTTRVLTSKRPR